MAITFPIELTDVQNGTVSRLFETINGNNDTIEEVLNTPMGTTQIANGAVTVDKLSKTNNIPDIFNILYPVGTYYWSSVDLSSNPQGSRGPLDYGVWERVKGKVIVGVDENDSDFNAPNKSDGEKKHTLTIEEMPSHTHTVRKVVQSSGNYTETTSGYKLAKIDTGSETTSPTGSGAAHNNMPPYITAYCWRRIPQGG